MLEKVTDRIYYLMNQDETDRPALGAVIGDTCSLIIDAGNSPKHAQEFKEELEKLNLPPVKYVVLTHYHWDHVLGLDNWNAVSIANSRTAQRMQEYRNIKYDDDSLLNAKEKGIFNDFGVKCIKTEISNRDSFQLGEVALEFDGTLKLDLGNLICHIRTIVSPHTDDSTIVYVPEEKTLFLGDCVYGYTKDGYNYFDSERLFQAIDIIEEYSADYYLCSHESICTREEILSYWEQLRSGKEYAEKFDNLEQAMQDYSKVHGSEPTGDDVYFMKSFGLR